MKRNQFIFILGLTAFLLSGAVHASDCKNIPAWLKLKHVTFRVVAATDVHDVKVEFPDLSKLKCSASPFEYGTDYYFTLDTSHPVKLSYFKKGETRVSRSTEMTEELNAHSVMIAAEREKTPHYFEITDEELDEEYNIYISEEKGPAYAKRKGGTQKFKIVSFE